MLDNKINIKETKNLHNGKHISLVEKSYSRGDKTGTYECVVRNSVSQIVSVLVLSQEDVILIDQFRIPHEKYIIENVAGLVDSGYTLEQTVQKECVEEIGYDVELSNIIHLGKTPSSSGITNESVDLFVATDAKKTQVMDSGELSEEINVISIPQENFSARLKNTTRGGKLLDSKIGHIVLLGALNDIKPLQKMILNQLIKNDMERLSSIQHDIWSKCISYIFDSGVNNSDGSVTLPKDMIGTYRELASKLYPELNERDKEKDRVQVRKFLQ